MKLTLTAPTAPISTATDGVFDRLFLTLSLRAQALSFIDQTNALLTNQHFSVKISPELNRSKPEGAGLHLCSKI